MVNRKTTLTTVNVYQPEDEEEDEEEEE